MLCPCGTVHLYWRSRSKFRRRYMHGSLYCKSRKHMQSQRSLRWDRRRWSTDSATACRRPYAVILSQLACSGHYFTHTKPYQTRVTADGCLCRLRRLDYCNSPRSTVVRRKQPCSPYDLQSDKDFTLIEFVVAVLVCRTGPPLLAFVLLFRFIHVQTPVHRPLSAHFCRATLC